MRLGGESQRRRPKDPSMKPSRAWHENTAAEFPKRHLHQLVTRAAQDFDTFYETRRVVTEAVGTGLVLVITVDAKRRRHGDGGSSRIDSES